MESESIPSTLERVSVAQASKELNIDPLTLRYALRQGKLPIGFALYKKRYTYIIYRNKLDAYKEGTVSNELQ